MRYVTFWSLALLVIVVSMFVFFTSIKHDNGAVTNAMNFDSPNLYSILEKESVNENKSRLTSYIGIEANSCNLFPRQMSFDGIRTQKRIGYIQNPSAVKLALLNFYNESVANNNQLSLESKDLIANNLGFQYIHPNVTQIYSKFQSYNQFNRHILKPFDIEYPIKGQIEGAILVDNKTLGSFEVFTDKEMRSDIENNLQRLVRSNPNASEFFTKQSQSLLVTLLNRTNVVFAKQLINVFVEVGYPINVYTLANASAVGVSQDKLSLLLELKKLNTAVTIKMDTHHYSLSSLAAYFSNFSTSLFWAKTNSDPYIDVELGSSLDLIVANQLSRKSTFQTQDLDPTTKSILSSFINLGVGVTNLDNYEAIKLLSLTNRAVFVNNRVTLSEVKIAEDLSFELFTQLKKVIEYEQGVHEILSICKRDFFVNVVANLYGWEEITRKKIFEIRKLRSEDADNILAQHRLGEISFAEAFQMLSKLDSIIAKAQLNYFIARIRLEEQERFYNELFGSDRGVHYLSLVATSRAQNWDEIEVELDDLGNLDPNAKLYLELFHHIQRNSTADSAQRLIDKGAPVSVSILSLAIQANNVDILNLPALVELLEKTKNTAIFNPLVIATRSGSFEVFERLIEKGIDAGESPSEGEDSLDIALGKINANDNSYVKFAQKLIALGKEIKFSHTQRLRILELERPDLYKKIVQGREADLDDLN
jgi:hypothetical protein